MKIKRQPRAGAVTLTVMELPLIYLIAFTLVFYRELKARPATLQVLR